MWKSLDYVNVYRIGWESRIGLTESVNKWFLIEAGLEGKERNQNEEGYTEP
jgi:hypothetical protein